MAFATISRPRASLLRALGLAILLALLSPTAPLAWAEPAWLLDPAASTLTYQSVKKNTIVETNTIRNLSGHATPPAAPGRPAQGLAARPPRTARNGAFGRRVRTG